ncbi:DUF805 domain-containing protein [Sphingomonas sp. LHG3443-2]|uniref:DUF805 domain-containing protein n=1 Tax=Sphingomonas sp. LHG3443-2 TaxID=2804639 RepID=UPI003CE8DDA4
MSPLDWAFLPLQRYFDFAGRSPRSEYWWFYLLVSILSMACGWIDLAVDPTAVVGVASLLVSLATIIPLLAVSVRRLHDRNRSGWNLLKPPAPGIVMAILAAFGPFGLFVGTIIFVGTCLWLVVLLCLPGTSGPNHYGEHPYGLQYYAT